MEIFFKNLNFGQKSKYSSSKFWSEFLTKKWNLGENRENDWGNTFSGFFNKKNKMWKKLQKCVMNNLSP